MFCFLKIISAIIQHFELHKVHVSSIYWATFQEVEKMSTIQLLPNEVLEHVFRHLPLAIDQQNLRLVCKKWREIIHQMRSIPSLNYTRLLEAGRLNIIQ